MLFVLFSLKYLLVLRMISVCFSYILFVLFSLKCLLVLHMISACSSYILFVFFSLKYFLAFHLISACSSYIFFFLFFLQCLLVLHMVFACFHMSSFSYFCYLVSTGSSYAFCSLNVFFLLFFIQYLVGLCIVSSCSSYDIMLSESFGLLSLLCSSVNIELLNHLKPLLCYVMLCYMVHICLLVDFFLFLIRHTHSSLHIHVYIYVCIIYSIHKLIFRCLHIYSNRRKLLGSQMPKNSCLLT